ncbi:hypothetical protein EVAR_102597_1 [Eumeta japonica]|uniref:Uncharacterized protein n=1 Tax=Eumeta variegata TaxID=151549 RepID=A0A4C1TUQ5_EUMVA|nr:hypothetical protein EVAR_102597_1 [Eumeta japonica]
MCIVHFVRTQNRVVRSELRLPVVRLTYAVRRWTFRAHGPRCTIEEPTLSNRIKPVRPLEAGSADARARNEGLMMEPEGKHRNSIIKQRILAVFGLVEIVLSCTLNMNDFQGLMMQLEGSDNGAGSLEAPSSDPESQSWSKSISGPFQQFQIWLGYIVPL